MVEDKIFCEKCREKLLDVASRLDESLWKETELEGGNLFPLDYLEELRLTIKSFLRVETLNALLALMKELDREPRATESFAFLVRNSEVGGECIYALQALDHFRKKRIDKTLELLEEALEEVKKMKEEDV